MTKQYLIKLSLIQLDASNYHIYTEGWINELKINLVIDTGASMTVFDRAFFKDHFSEVSESGEKIRSAGITADKIDSVYRAVAEKFMIGNLVINQYPVMLIDMEGINKLYKEVTGRAIHGLLGSDFLHSMRAVIDYGKSIMILKPDDCV